jgi:hypothetical protein
LYGFPVDPRLAEGSSGRWRRSVGRRSWRIPPSRWRSRSRGTRCPRTSRVLGGRRGERRPLVVLTNGYDATVVDICTWRVLGRSSTAAVTACSSTGRVRVPAGSRGRRDGS